MTKGGIVFVVVLILNILIVLGYLIYWLILKKDEDNRKQYFMNSVIMLLCPVVGVLYFFISFLKYHVWDMDKRDLSDVVFSKQRHKPRVKADENRERNIVSVEESILVSDQDKKRTNMLNVMLGETDESYSAIAQALDSDDSEVAHYAASFLQTKMDTFRENVRKAQKEIEEGDVKSPEIQKKILTLITYMNQMLKQKVFTDVEQIDYVSQMELLCSLLYEHAQQSMTITCYENMVNRFLEMKAYDKAGLWGDRFHQQYPDHLSSYTLRLKLYFESNQKERFFEVLDQLKASSVVVDNHTLELIRMVQR